MIEKITEQMKHFNNLNSEINAAYHDISQKLGLSDSSMQILYTICSFGESCLLTDICKFTGISKQTINSALRKLEAEGIVILQTYSGLKKNVKLTDKGKALSKTTACKIIRIENEIFNSWSNEDTNKYIELTQKYLKDFKAKINDI